MCCRVHEHRGVELLHLAVEGPESSRVEVLAPHVREDLRAPEPELLHAPFELGGRGLGLVERDGRESCQTVAAPGDGVGGRVVDPASGRGVAVGDPRRRRDELHVHAALGHVAQAHVKVGEGVSPVGGGPGASLPVEIDAAFRDEVGVDVDAHGGRSPGERDAEPLGNSVPIRLP